jgi:2-iminobutanoate/2-iminopropanoate deaminase
MTSQRLIRQVAGRVVLPLAALLIAAGNAGAQEADKPQPVRDAVHVPGSLEGLPFSPAVRAAGLVFVSGQIGNRPGTRQFAEGGVTGQTRQALANINTVLEAAGLSLYDVVKCTVFLADIADYAVMNEVYAGYFPEDPPARSTVAVSGLALDAALEIECIARDNVELRSGKP